MKILEERIRACSEKHKKAGVELHATCHICLKTKFADGVGHICNYCSIRCCARCGGKVTLRSTKVGERSGKKRQDILSGGIEPSPRSNSPLFFFLLRSRFTPRRSRVEFRLTNCLQLSTIRSAVVELSTDIPGLNIGYLASHRLSFKVSNAIFVHRYRAIDEIYSRLRIFSKLSPIFQSFKRVTFSFFFFFNWMLKRVSKRKMTG